MTASGDDFAKKRSKCKYRKTRIDKETRTSGGGRFYDYCSLRHKECEKQNCISIGGE